MLKNLKVRNWEPGDMEELARLHKKMRVGYPLPRSFGPLYCIRKVVCDVDGKVIAMATVKLVSEAFFFTDPDSSSIVRARGLKILHEECYQAAKEMGLEEVSCWIPAKIAGYFSKTIQKLGWLKSPWRCWTLLIK